jgi:2-methylcitrate dehydratase PrpD
VDEDIEREWSRFVTPAKVTIQFRDGHALEARVDYARGHPNNPMSRAEFTAKSADCARLAVRPLAADVATRLSDAVHRLETADDLAELMAVLS